MILYDIVLTENILIDIKLTHDRMGGVMKKRNVELDEHSIKAFNLRKVLTITELSKILVCSIITVRRRLKEWRTYTSYNKNGRYYTLPSIPKFNKKGIWTYKDIFFSRYGTLKNTIIALAAKSKQGLTHSELEEIIWMNPKCFMARFKEVPGLRKEKYKNKVVYFSADPDIYKSQKQNRFPPESSVPKLPPDAMTIVVLVELIQNPGISIEALSSRLHDQGYKIEANTIGNLFKHYNISKKKLNMK